MSDKDKINNLVYLRDGSVLQVDGAGQLYAVDGAKARRLHIQRRSGFIVARFGDRFPLVRENLIPVHQPKDTNAKG